MKPRHLSECFLPEDKHPDFGDYWTDNISEVYFSIWEVPISDVDAITSKYLNQIRRNLNRAGAEKLSMRLQAKGREGSDGAGKRECRRRHRRNKEERERPRQRERNTERESSVATATLSCAVHGVTAVVTTMEPPILLLRNHRRRHEKEEDFLAAATPTRQHHCLWISLRRRSRMETSCSLAVAVKKMSGFPSSFVILSELHAAGVHGGSFVAGKGRLRH
ncbi:hypothetical protein PIB30_073878 [Stylosanthes scabra]|uniref:Uncharacterized protein n=1 Tax=Stylosanthes scabra TaxID=79078 RepID=A0ABU6XMF2_9FABA|nr:hypothetical protein [Stylosanthes scabra]